MHKKKVCTYAKFLEKKKSFFRNFFFATGLIFERFLAPRSRFFEKVNGLGVLGFSGIYEFSKDLDSIYIVLGSFENSYIPENPRTPPISYISQTVIPFKKPTSKPSKTGFETKQKTVHICTKKKFAHMQSFWKKKVVFSENFFATGLIFERFLAPRSRFFEKVNGFGSGENELFGEKKRRDLGIKGDDGVANVGHKYDLEDNLNQSMLIYMSLKLNIQDLIWIVNFVLVGMRYSTMTTTRITEKVRDEDTVSGYEFAYGSCGGCFESNQKFAHVPISKLNKATTLSSRDLDMDYLSMLAENLPQMFICNIGIQTTNKYLQPHAKIDSEGSEGREILTGGVRPGRQTSIPAGVDLSKELDDGLNSKLSAMEIFIDLLQITIFEAHITGVNVIPCYRTTVVVPCKVSI
ncbi:hypothetical protein LXL04_010056 [Taraxacum kok-saghyz]